MAKNLKFNIKNAQLAEALKLGKKAVPSANKMKKKEEELPKESQVAFTGAEEKEKHHVQVPTTSPVKENDIEIPSKPTAFEQKSLKEEKEIEIKEPAPFREKESIEGRPFSGPSNFPRTGGQSTSYSPPRRNEGFSPPPRRFDGTPPPPASRAPYPNRPYTSPQAPQGGYRSSSGQRPPFQRSGPGGGPPQGASSYAPRPPFRPDNTLRPAAPRDAQKPFTPRAAPSSKPSGSFGPPEAPKKPQARDFRDVKPAKKGLQEGKVFDSRDRQGLRDTDNEGWRKKRSFKSRNVIQEDVIRPKELAVRLPITVKDLASEMKLKASQLIAKLFMQGIVITLNDFLDDATVVQLLGHEFDCNITIDTSEEERIQITGKSIKEEIHETEPSLLRIRPPVVAFMGHVDHGKTSIIDAIRKTNRAAGEAGAITQHIGAFCCHTPVGNITVLDTPGHEAFASMRERGADVTDIVVLVVAGDEGLRAQTLEAIAQAKAAKVPIVVALNKSDKPGFNPDDVYRQLSEHELLPEVWGGTTIVVPCSAVTGSGIKELLEMLALQAEVLELTSNPSGRARGAVIESEMHKGLGAQATVLVQNGTLRLGDALVFDQHWGRVKTMHDEALREVKEAEPSTPVKITGLSGLPEAGSEFIVVRSEKEARELGEARTLGQKNLILQQTKKMGIEGLLQQKAEGVGHKILHVILRADVQGSLEALKTSLLKIHSKKVSLNIISAAVGEVSESDIQLAAASKAIILGFHTKIESHAESLIKELKVVIKLHDIIYHAVDDVKVQMVSLLDKLVEEVHTGSALVTTTFKASQLGVIAGCLVTQGSIRRNQGVKLIRDGKVVWKGSIASLKRVKEDVREVAKGLECGILLQNYGDVKPNDIIEAFDINYLVQEL